MFWAGRIKVKNFCWQDKFMHMIIPFPLVDSKLSPNKMTPYVVPIPRERKVEIPFDVMRSKWHK